MYKNIEEYLSIEMTREEIENEILEGALELSKVSDKYETAHLVNVLTAFKEIIKITKKKRVCA